MTEQEKAQRDRVIEAVFPVIADRMGWHHRIDEHPPRNTNFACDIADAAIAALTVTPQEAAKVREKLERIVSASDYYRKEATDHDALTLAYAHQSTRNLAIAALDDLRAISEDSQ